MIMGRTVVVQKNAYDISTSTLGKRQLDVMMVIDLNATGIAIKPTMNSKGLIRELPISAIPRIFKFAQHAWMSGMGYFK